MSYEKVKSISIEENKVFINSHSNNDTAPYSNVEYPYFSKILQEKGLRELDISLLKEYESGNLQGGINKYTKALEVLYYVLKEEYKPFSWRNEGEKYEKAKVLRETQAFKDLLFKALNTKLPKERFIVFNSVNGYYVKKETSRHIFYTNNKDEAKIYKFKEQAQRTAEHIRGEVVLK